MSARTTVHSRLTETQQAILDFMVECELTGLPATYREIMAHFGMRSYNAVRDQVLALIKKGRLWRSNGAHASRSLRVTIIERKKS